MMTESGMVQTVILGGKRYVILPEADFRRLTGEPILPEPDKQGNFPAVESMRVLIARDLIRSRRLLGLTQAELACRAGIAAETLSRIEQGHRAPSLSTIEKVTRALEKAEGEVERPSARKRRRGGA